MFTQQEITKIKNIVKEFFEKMGISVVIEVKESKDETLPIDIKTEEPQILIGEKGQTLVEIQRLLKVILKRKIDKNFYIE